MKKLMSWMVIIGLFLSFNLSVLTVAAASSASEPKLGYITDIVGILSQSESAELEEKAREITEKYHCAVYGVILDDFSRYADTIEECGESLYQECDLGYGEDKDGIILLLSMADRDYTIIDFGEFGNYAVTDYGRDKICDKFLDDFADDEWYDGFEDYLEESAVILEHAKDGTPFGKDTDRFPLSERILFSYGIALIISMVIALIVCTIFKQQMKTAVKAGEAENYVLKNEINIYAREDRYTHTTRTERKINNNSGKSSGGGGSNSRSGKF